MYLKAKLKVGQLYIGDKRPFNKATVKQERLVIITAKENHPIWGERYQIEDSVEWYEKNCFEWIEEE